MVLVRKSFHPVIMDSVLMPGNFEFIDTDQSLRPRRDEIEHENDPLTGPMDSVDDPHYDPGIRFDSKDVVRIKATAASTVANGVSAPVARARRPSSRTTYTDDGIAYDPSSKTYICEICDKKSVWKYFMERHRRTHIGRRVERGSMRNRNPRIRTPEVSRRSERNRSRLRKRKETKPDETKRIRATRRRTSKRPEIENDRVPKTKGKHKRPVGEKPNGTTKSEVETVPEIRVTDRRPDEIELTCAFCDKRFESSAALRRHVEAHTAVRRLACETCDRRFLHRTSLRNHLETHIDEDDDVECPTVCQICEKVFRSRRHLKMHLTTHV